MLHELYKEILGFKDHRILAEAFNGLECIEFVNHKNLTPDVIIMDHRMPVKNGLETTVELLKEKPNLKIVFVSADASIEEEAKSAGCSPRVKAC